MRRLRALPPQSVDRVLALVLLVPAAIEAVLVATGTAEPFAVLLVAVMAGTIAFRRVVPLPALVVLFAAAIPLVLLINESESFATPFLLVLIWSYTVGAIADLRTALIGLAIVFVGIAGVSASFGDPIVGDFVFPWGFATATWAAARALQHRNHLAAELHEAAVRAEEEREAQAARAVADERRRIAREMHDVVAHSVSVMVVQAGGARRILARDPERAAEAARLIERTGRGALLEMRRLLGVLGTGDEPAAMAPQPSVDEIEALVERARGAGLAATLSVEGERRPLPAGAEAAVYRVVQEALTNALKHAAGAPTDVLLRWGPEELEVVVADGGRSAAGSPGAAGRAAEDPSLPSGGHGIVGMRERVKVYGGSLSALPGPDGGFVVRARLPLDEAVLRVA
jgi:signal transduction histidine kinase